MYINEIDIQRYEARQVNVVIGNHAITNASQWPRGSLSPVLESNHIGMKPIKVVMSVRGDGREKICDNVSKILSLLLEPVTLILDGFTHKFRAALKNHDHKETCMRRWHVLTLQFEGYELGLEEEVSATGTSISVVNAGNLISPCIIEVTSATDLDELTLEGLSTPITIYNLSAGKTVTIDGESGLMLEDEVNKFPEMDIDELPYLFPGEAVITSSAEVTVTIKHSPRYM